MDIIKIPSNIETNIEDIKGEISSLKTTAVMIRADTGELNGTAVLDQFVTNDLSLPGNITVKNLYVLDGATLSGAFNIVVTENVYVYSSHINISGLDVKGNLTVQRKVGDSSTTNAITLSALSVLGFVTISNTTFNTGITNINGNFTGNNSSCFYTLNAFADVNFTDTSLPGGSVILGNLDMSGGNINGNIFVGGNANISTTGSITAEIVKIGGNASLANCIYNQNVDYIIEVQGDCTISNLSCNHIRDWTVHGTLTMDAMPTTGSININAGNLIFNGSSISSTYNYINSAYNGTNGFSNYSTLVDGIGGIGAACSINVTGLLSFNYLTTITLTASNGGNGTAGGSYTGGSSAGGGGSCYLNLSANEITSTNIFTINMTAGNGGNGGSTSYASTIGRYVCGSGGGGGSISDTGGAGGNYNDLVFGGDGGGGGQSINIHSTVAFSNYSIGTLSAGTGGTGGYSSHDGLYGYSGAAGTTDSSVTSTLLGTFSDWTIPDNFIPTVPVQVTEDKILNPTLLTFTPPDFLETIDLDFAIEIKQQFTEKIFQTVVSENSNDNPSSFSGTPPYESGSEDVSFTIPDLSSGTYRWRVKSIKDSDTSKESLFSDWRLFTISA